MPFYYKGTATLAYGVRSKVLLRYVGQLAIALAGLPAVPGFVGLALGRPAEALPYLVLAAGLAASGSLLARVRPPVRLQRNEALVITALIFLLASLLMSWPFAAAAPSYLDALFESVSAITTTGLSTLASVEGASPVFLFARAWAQWYGGLVIVALAIAIVLEPGVVTKRFAQGELESEDLAGSARIRARRALVFYSALTLAGTLALMLAGVPAFDALLHALSGASTGGFSSRDASIAALGGLPVQAILSLLSVVGAVSFSVAFVAWRRGWRVIAGDLEIRLLLVLVVIVAVVVAVDQAEAAGPEGALSLADSIVLAFSSQTTTGFANVDVAGLENGSKVALIVSMVIGGDAGSTAGGIKLGRVLVLFAAVSLILFRAALPRRAVTHLAVGGRRVDPAGLEGIVAIVVLYVMVIAVLWFAFILAGYDGLDALFEVTSAVGTVGLSAGLAGPDLAPGLKLLLCAGMLMGRLEIIAVLILFYHRTWFARRSRTP